MDNMNSEKSVDISKQDRNKMIAKVLAVTLTTTGMGAALTGCEKAFGAEGTPNSHVSYTDKQTPSLNELISATIERTKNPTATQAPTEIVTPTQNPTATEAPTVNPTQNPTATEAPTPTQVIETPAPTDNLKIPEGLTQEDYNVRLAVKGAFELPSKLVNQKNSFSLDENEVKQYIATGETNGFNTFELVKDPNGKPAFVVIKGGDNGYTPDQMAVIKRTITKMNQLDPNLLRTMADYGVRIIAYDVGNFGIFEKNPGWGGSYINDNFGGVLFSNTKNMYINDPDVDFDLIATFFCESRALYTTRYSTDGTWYTNAPDRLNDKIGLDKSYLAIQWSDNLFAQGKITKDQRDIFQSSCNDSIAYYTNNP